MMKKNILGAVAIAALAFSGSSFAQLCTADNALTGANSGTTTAAFDTCTATDQLAEVCSASTPIGNAQDAIWSIQIGPGAHSGNLIVNTSAAGYNTYLALMSGTCSAAAPCPVEADSNGAGGSETLDLSALANGTYYLLVTSFGAECGPVTITVPTLPVALKGFSVE